MWDTPPQSSLMSRRDYTISYKRLLPIFEENIQATPFLSVTALYKISLLIKQSEDMFQYFKASLASKSLFAKLAALVTSKGAGLREQLLKFESSNYGHPVVGYFDHIFTFLNTFLEKIAASKEDVSLFFVLLKESQLDQKIVEVFDFLDQELLLSPKGLLGFLIFVCDCATLKRSGGAFFLDAALSSAAFARYTVLLGESQFLAVKEWPPTLGGGEQGAELLVSQIARVFQLCFNQNVLPFNLVILI